MKFVQYKMYRALFKWLLKVITGFWLKISHRVLNRCTSDFSRSLSKLHGIVKNSDWFIGLSAPVVSGRCNYFCIGFSTVISKSLHYPYFYSISDKAKLTEENEFIKRLFLLRSLFRLRSLLRIKALKGKVFLYSYVQIIRNRLMLLWLKINAT